MIYEVNISKQQEQELIKALNTSGLVQREVRVQRKDGTVYTRKQMVRATDVKDSK